MTSSPTLAPGSSYYSVVAEVPTALAERVLAWRSAHRLVDAGARSCHITVLITQCDSLNDSQPDFQPESQRDPVSGLSAALAGFGVIRVRLGLPETFEPVSPVTYLPLLQGAEQLGQLHWVCQQVVGASASPFAYVPHLTLAHSNSQGLLAASQRDFADLEPALTDFELRELKISRYSDGSWQELGAIPLL